MSTHYKDPSEVPTEVLIERLEELATEVTQGKTLYMSIPAEPDKDADLVLMGAAARLKSFLGV